MGAERKKQSRRNKYKMFIEITNAENGRRDSVVRIAPGYRLDVPGIESQRARFSVPSKLAPRPTQPPVRWVPRLSRG